MIFRRVHTAHYTVIGNNVMNDDRLTAEALGLLGYLLSRPTNWEVRTDQLCVRFNCGRERILKMLKGLIDLGYAVRKKLPTGGVEYHIYDIPEPKSENQIEGQSRENPSCEKPETENPTPLLNTDLLTSTERKEQNTDSAALRSVVRADDWPENFMDEFWNNFPPARKGQKGKVLQKLGKLRANKVKWADLFGGVMRYAASQPGEYGKAPLAWLNGELWDSAWPARTPPGGGSGGPSLADIARGNFHGK